MLLGSEFELLSMIAKCYKRHQDGFFKFSELDFKENFSDEFSFAYLKRLEEKGFASWKGELIFVDSSKWVSVFISLLEISLTRINCIYKLSFSPEDCKLYFKEGNTIKKSFLLNFEEDKYDISESIINFCYVSTFDYYLFWLDLLNDINVLHMFCNYLNNEISSFNFTNRIRFNFFDGLDDKYLSEIFHVSLPKYFTEGNLPVRNLVIENKQKILRYLGADDYDAFEVSTTNYVILVIKSNNKIDFICIVDNKLEYPPEVLEEIQKLENILKIKLSEYRKLVMFNENQVIENTQKITGVVSIILNPISIVLCAMTALGVNIIGTIKNNVYALIGVGVLLIILSIFIFIIIIMPAVRLSRFSWNIKFPK